MLYKRINIVTGHYGSGKTNVAINMAVDIANKGNKVYLVDLDIVNPYFRSADVKDTLNNNIEVIAPVFANTNLDIPSLPADIEKIFINKDYYVVIDVGGDDDGAIALGTYSSRIKNEDYDLFYVINSKRQMIKDPNDAVNLLREIEYVSRLKGTKLINNSHLCYETDENVILTSVGWAEDISKLSSLPIAFNAVRKDLIKNLEGKITDVYPIDIYTGQKI